MSKVMLKTEEKNLLSLIATDLETGRHLLRKNSDWKKVLRSCGDNLKKTDYDNLKKELETAINKFSWYSDEDETTAREKEILIRFKASQDYDFYIGLRKNV